MRCRTVFALAAVAVSLSILPAQAADPMPKSVRAERVKAAASLRDYYCKRYGQDDPLCKYFRRQVENEMRELLVEK